MIRTSESVTALIIMLGIVATAHAHHAMEYIEMESYTTARKGELVFHLHYDYMVDDADNPKADHWELTPGVSYGIADRLMLDVHSHFAKFGAALVVPDRFEEFNPTGPSPFMEAAAASMQFRIGQGWPIDLGAVVTLEVPFSRAEEVLGSEDNLYAGLLILGKDFGEHSNVTLNLGYEIEGDADESSWAIGAKTPISPDPHGIAAGLELLGSFENVGENWSVLPGLYMPLGAQHVTFKTGLEFGKGDGADTMRANVTLMYRF